MTPADLADVRTFFVEPQVRFVIDSMIAGNTPAVAWASSSGAVVFDGAHCLYIAGTDPAAVAVVADLAQGRDGLVKVYGDNLGLPGRSRSLYATAFGLSVAGPEVSLPEVSLPDGYQIASIVESVEDLRPLHHFSALLDEVTSMWGSDQAFLARGFGFCAHDGTTIASWCTAEYVSPGRCGIGIETVQRFRGQGLATAVGAAFVRSCVSRSMVAHWDAWTDNAPSIAVAEKLGFSLLTTYAVGVTTFAELSSVARTR